MRHGCRILITVATLWNRTRFSRVMSPSEIANLPPAMIQGLGGVTFPHLQLG